VKSLNELHFMAGKEDLPHLEPCKLSLLLLFCSVP